MTGRRVLVTGAAGFVGRALVPRLAAAGWAVRPATRAETGDIGPGTDWRPLLADLDAVVHLAARVHVMRDRAADPEHEFDRVNHRAAAALAAQAATAGVRRFVFLSSIKVHGDASDHPLAASDAPAPDDAYGRSKLAAERALANLGGGMTVVALRPPLVYGPGVKGNFRAMLRAIDRGWPLPLGAIANRRSLIYVGNLADAIRTALDAPPGTYLPSDREDVSTPELIRRAAEALGRPARLFPMPPGLLRGLAVAAGKATAADRLTGSLTVDGALPGWRPPVSMAEGLRATADWFRAAAAGGRSGR
jgi:UDP-N-acetyl-alpha-D-quinovosamine dehydrogenase